MKVDTGVQILQVKPPRHSQPRHHLVYKLLSTIPIGNLVVLIAQIMDKQRVPDRPALSLGRGKVHDMCLNYSPGGDRFTMNRLLFTNT